MLRTTYDLMKDQLQAIYRALTGSEITLSEGESTVAGAAPSAEELEQRFADLEAMARKIPTVAERVPPFAFAPPVDVIDEEKDLLIEAVIPGIERDDAQIAVHDGTLTLEGVRRGGRVSDGRTYLYAEIPRGPFRRVLKLPYAVSTEPRVEVERGLVRIWFRKIMATA